MKDTINSLNAALIEAVVAGDTPKVVLLLDAGADPNAVDEKYGVTALRDAVDGAEDDCEHSDLVQVLLERGADPNQDTPLIPAAYHGYTETVRLLLSHGVDPNQKVPGENTPLQDAKQYGHSEIGDMLQAAGAHD